MAKRMGTQMEHDGLPEPEGEDQVSRLVKLVEDQEKLVKAARQRAKLRAGKSEEELDDDAWMLQEHERAFRQATADLKRARAARAAARRASS